MLNRGCQAQLPLLEERLVKWINECCNEQNAVTQNMIMRKARLFAQTSEFKNIYPNIDNLNSR